MFDVFNIAAYWVGLTGNDLNAMVGVRCVGYDSRRMSSDYDGGGPDRISERLKIYLGD